jgi:hypothetical protein
VREAAYSLMSESEKNQASIYNVET